MISWLRRGAGSAEQVEPAPAVAEQGEPEVAPLDSVEFRRPLPTPRSWHAGGRPVIGEPGSIANVVPRVAASPGAYRPAMTADLANVGNACIAAASLKGTVHHEFGTVRQDSYGLGTVGDRYAVLAIADGVSQAKHSHVAADLACQTSVTSVVQALSDGLRPAELDWPALIDEVRAVLRRRAAATLPADLGEATQDQIDLAIATQLLSTTLDVIVLTTDVSPVEYVVASLAGDGSAYLHDAGVGWDVLIAGKDPESEVVSTRVQALPLDPGTPTLRTGTLAAGTALMVCTDGVGDHLGAGNNELGRFLSIAWGEPVAAPEFLRGLDFVHAGALDDRTAVIAW